MHGLARGGGQLAQGVEPEVSEQLVGHLREDAAHGVVALQSGFKLLLLDAHLAHHVFDDALVLAAQFVQFAELLAQAGEARFEETARTHVDVRKFGVGVVADDVLLGRNELVGQRQLKLRQAAAFKQCVVAVDLGNQCLLR